MSTDPNQRSRSDGVAKLRADVVRDLRADSHLQDALADPGGFSPREQVVTPLTAPSESDDLPPALLVIDAYATSSRHRNSSTEISYEVEAGLTVTQEWVEYWDPSHPPRQVGTNPDLALGAIMDAVSERAHVMFDIPNMTMGPGGSGGSMPAPSEGGERSVVRSWLFTRTRG